MHLVYIDDSGDGALACFSALIIPVDEWRASLDHLLGARRSMRDSDGIRMKVELHATDWNGGKGALARIPISKQRRAELYDFFLSSIAMLPGAQLINAAVPSDEQLRGFSYLLNRIQKNMQVASSQAIIFVMRVRATIHLGDGRVGTTTFLVLTDTGLMAEHQEIYPLIVLLKILFIEILLGLSLFKRLMPALMHY